MPERLERRSALASVAHAGSFGTVGASGPGITLAECRGLALVQLATGPAHADAMAARVEAALKLPLPRLPNSATRAGELGAYWTGPGRVLVVGPEEGGLEEALGQALAGLPVALTDLSHSRTVIHLTGPRLRELLAKGCGVDFHARAFKAGSIVQSAYAHIGVLVAALDDRPTVELHVYRGFAVSLWEHLLDGALEFGCRVER